jgi:CubicO group peptidase (beta-lactamase class C family)
MIFLIAAAPFMGTQPAMVLSAQTAEFNSVPAESAPPDAASPGGALPDGRLPSGVAFSNLEAAVDSYAEQHKDQTAGMSISVFAGNDTLLEKACGYSNIEDGIANSFSTVFEWDMVTELLVWVSVMQLQEQRKLDLDTDIRTYLPDGFFRMLKYDDPITMKHLMNRTTGWQFSFKNMDAPAGSAPQELENVLRAMETAQNFRPGEHSAFKPYEAALAGYIVERISGVPFYEYVHTHIFSPLGMEHTALKSDQRQPYPANMAKGTLADFRVFAQALLPDENGSSPLFEKNSTLMDMHTATLYFMDSETARICHGLTTFPHLSGNVRGCAGFTASLRIDPDSGIGMVVMTNQGELVYNHKMTSLIFGNQAEISGLDTDTNPVGKYLCAAAPRKGITKFLGALIWEFSVLQNKDGSLYGTGGHFIPVFDITQLQQSVYMLSASADGIDRGLMYVGADAEGRATKLEIPGYIPGFDAVRLNPATPILWGVLLLCFVAAAIYGLVILIVMFIRRFRKRKQPLGILRACVCAASLGAVVNLFVFLTFFMSYAGLTPAALTIFGILFILFASVPVVYLVITALRLKNIIQQPDAAKNLKRHLITPAVMGMLTTVNVLYWELWRFWV